MSCLRPFQLTLQQVNNLLVFKQIDANYNAAFRTLYLNHLSVSKFRPVRLDLLLR